MLDCTAEVIVTILFIHVHDLQKYRLAKYLPEAKEGNSDNKRSTQLSVYCILCMFNIVLVTCQCKTCQTWIGKVQLHGHLIIGTSSPSVLWCYTQLISKLAIVMHRIEDDSNWLWLTAPINFFWLLSSRWKWIYRLQTICFFKRKHVGRSEYSSLLVFI